MEIVELKPSHREALAAFFVDIEADHKSQHFRPHPFDADHVLRVSMEESWCAYVMVDRRILAYGILRGWPPQYEMPRLGIAVHPGSRRMGIGMTMMEVLHCTVRLRGRPGVDLKVHDENIAAFSMYVALGYQWVRREGDNSIYRIEFK
jgi:ribosomal protein S18 acetylase RimI-like enzyme